MRDARAGDVDVALPSALSGRALAPGTYALRLAATDRAGLRSAPVTTTFTVTTPRPRSTR